MSSLQRLRCDLKSTQPQGSVAVNYQAPYNEQARIDHPHIHQRCYFLVVAVDGSNLASNPPANYFRQHGVVFRISSFDRDSWLRMPCPFLDHTKISAVELKLEQVANDAERHKRRSSFSQSIQEAKQRAERETLPASNVTGGRRRSRMKRRGR